MHWPPSLDQLHTALVGLYPDGEDARRVARAAQLCIDRLAPKNEAALVWRSILEMATKQRRVRALIQVALLDHPNDVALRVAASAFCRWLALGRPAG